jgi:hypothetical protein
VEVGCCGDFLRLSGGRGSKRTMPAVNQINLRLG